MILNFSALQFIIPIIYIVLFITAFWQSKTADFITLLVGWLMMFIPLPFLIDATISMLSGGMRWSIYLISLYTSIFSVYIGSLLSTYIETCFVHGFLEHVRWPIFGTIIEDRSLYEITQDKSNKENYSDIDYEEVRYNE